MYGKGMSQRYISGYIEKLYSLTMSAQTISRMTDKIIPLAEEW